MPAIYISAAHKSSGKTTLSIGICRALRDSGLSVQAFKKGPDYIDPLWLSSATGRSCYNLDFNTQTHDELRALFAQKSIHCDLTLIEGNVGLFDGIDIEGSDSNAAMAKLLRVPVVLVINTRGMTRGIAPLILGYQSFDPQLQIAGVILNQVGGSRHEQKLREVIAHYTDLPVLGALQADPTLTIDERHLGLIPSNEEAEAEALIERLSMAVSSQVDLDRLLGVARMAQEPETVEAVDDKTAIYQGLSIGYSKDRAFGFYYPDDLERIEQLGARLVPFDTLKDAELPDVDGFFLGGGFPETVMLELEANQTLMAQLAGFIEKGGPVYAECGGLIYLSRTLTWHGKTCSMAGVIPGDTVMYDRPQGRGYVQLTETQYNPWPPGPEQGVVHAHEFHYSSLHNLQAPEQGYAFDVVRGYGLDGRHEGYLYKNLLASYTHRRNTAAHRWVDRFLAWVAACKR